MCRSANTGYISSSVGPSHGLTLTMNTNLNYDSHAISIHRDYEHIILSSCPDNAQLAGKSETASAHRTAAVAAAWLHSFREL